MKKLRIAVYSQNNESVESLMQLSQQMENSLEVSALKDEEEVIASISAKSYDLLLLDSILDEMLKTRIYKMAEMLYPESAYTDLNLSMPSFVSLKLNQFVQKWDDANSEDTYNFIENPL